MSQPISQNCPDRSAFSQVSSAEPSEEYDFAQILLNMRSDTSSSSTSKKPALKQRKIRAVRQDPIITRLGTFEVIKKIGEGEFCHAYLCRWVEQGKDVVIKKFKNSCSQDHIANAKRQYFQLISDPEFPMSVARIFNIDKAQQDRMFIQELVDTDMFQKDLDDRKAMLRFNDEDQDPIPLEESPLWRQLKNTIVYCYRHKIAIDLRPSNIGVNESGSLSYFDPNPFYAEEDDDSTNLFLENLEKILQEFSTGNDEIYNFLKPSLKKRKTTPPEPTAR